MSRQALGRKGEELARAVAEGQGYSVVQCNYRCCLGEIDLILEKEDIVVFLEVKTRRSERYGEPWESVAFAKQKRIRRVAAWYVSQTDLGNKSFRFDVFTIQACCQPWQYRWFKGAF